MSDADLPMWAVYDRPRDFPTCYVARLWLGERPTEEVILATDVEDIRAALRARGLVKLMRQPEDHPKIMESWL